MSEIIKKRKGMSRTSKRLIFSLLMVALPVSQFLIFYVYVNFNSILMSFQEYSPNLEGLGYIVKFAGFENFADAAAVLFSEYGANMVKNSLILYACNLIIVNDLYLTYFGSYCPESEKLSYAETVALQNSFLADAAKVGLTAVAEQKYVSYLRVEWQQWQADNAPQS